MIATRKAVPSDAESIAELERAYVDDPWTAEQIREEILNDRAIFLVATDGDIIGFLSGVCAADECEISDIAVSEAYRRQGIATRLFSELITSVSIKGVNKMFLLVRSDNEPAIALYDSLGFKKVGKRGGYYAGGADAVIMRLEL